jgi:hypothetical protein
MPPEEEEWHIREGIKSYIKTIGKPPVGWFVGRPSPRTRSLIAKVYQELGLELLYFSDDYSDDLPHWTPSPAGDYGLLHVPCEFTAGTRLII